jgi:hypothetical protein
MLATNKAPKLAVFKEAMSQVLKQAEMLAQTQAQTPPPIRSVGGGVHGKLYVPQGSGTTRSAAFCGVMP